MAKGVAEIALLLVLLETGVIEQDIFSLLVLMMFGYIVLMPQAISFTVNRARGVHSPTLPDAVPPSFARHAMEDITVNHVLDRTRTYSDPTVSLRNFVDNWIVPNQHDYVVVDEGAVAGTVSVSRLPSVPRDSWADTPLRDVLHTDPPHALPEEPIQDVLKRMTDHSLSVIPVLDGDSDEFLGTVTSQDVLEPDPPDGGNRRRTGADGRSAGELTCWSMRMTERPCKILVVDDEPDLEPLVRQRMRRAIRTGRYAFVFASNGVEALERLNEDQDIDMVLSDINMPQMDGLALLEQIPKVDPNIRSVIISAYGDTEEHPHGDEPGRVRLRHQAD